MFRLLRLLNKREYLFIFFVLVLVFIQVYFELLIPDYMSKITRLVETPGSELRDILINGGYMLLFALISVFLAVIIGYLSSIVSSTLSKNIRKKVFTKVNNFGMEEMKKFSVASLITRTTNDITHIQMFLSMGLVLIARCPIMASLAIVKIFNKGFEWSLATFIAVLVLILIMIVLIIVVLPNFKKVQKYIDDVNNVSRENLKGIKVVHAFNAESYEEEKFDVKNKELTKIQMFNQKAMAIMAPTVNFVMHALMISIYVIGMNLMIKASVMDRINIFSNMVVFSSYSIQIIMSFILLTVIFIIYPRANVSARRINEVLNSDINIKNGTVKKSKEEGTVEFKNVSFKYPDGQDDVLKGINFKVEKGTTTAIIGSTGSGKTTLINLIPRFYDVTYGNVYVDGIDVREYDLEYLYNKIGYVSQKAEMFSLSVMDNVDYGRNGKKTSKDDIKNAIKIAQAEDFVLDMEDGYNDMISHGGTNLSGGQKQRISIARAIARKPEIFIFDDSFSALDYKTDKNLRNALKKNCKGSTKIIVAQRIGTIMDADQIIVLNEGECVGIGTHSELLKLNKVYQEIAYSQLSKEELENGKRRKTRK